MSRSPIIYSSGHLLSSIIMMLALAWLTISLPFVNAMQQAVQHQAETHHNQSTPDDCSNTLTNTTEEKTESNSNTLSEYLHDIHSMDQHTSSVVTYYKCHADDVYYAFHPTLISPPPEA